MLASNTGERCGKLQQIGKRQLLAAAAILIAAALCLQLLRASQVEARRNDRGHLRRMGSQHGWRSYNITVDHSDLITQHIYHDETCKHGWAYAAATLLEYLYYRITKQPKRASALSLIDCAPTPPGGAYPTAMGLSLSTSRGIPSNYSYEAAGGGRKRTGCSRGECLTNKAKIDWMLPGCIGEVYGMTLTGGAEISYIKKVLKIYPVIASLNNELIKDTKKNGIHPYQCDLYQKYGNNADHAVLLVGYGVNTLTNEEFFRYLNSRGRRWGDLGYGHIQIDPSGKCNTFTQIAFPQLKCKIN